MRRKREEVGVDDAGEILQNIAVSLEMELRTQTYSPVPLCENQQKVCGTVFAKDNGEKKALSERMTQTNTREGVERRYKVSVCYGHYRAF